MNLNDKTLEELRIIINGDEEYGKSSEYRTGADLVSFFNVLGFNDSYCQGFPSRWMYTDERLSNINGTRKMEECIKNTFAVINFIGRIDRLDELINGLNQYLAFDKLKIKRDNDKIIFEKADKIIIDAPKKKTNDLTEEEFLKQKFEDVDISSLGLENLISDIIDSRISEIKICLENESPLGAIFLIGSTLEGILLGVASINPNKYRQADSAPKKDFQNWSLNNFINVSYEIGFLKEDVYQFSHVLREFRNYIHPFKQMSLNFNPDQHTAEICWQVLRAGINQLPKN